MFSLIENSNTVYIVFEQKVKTISFILFEIKKSGCTKHESSHIFCTEKESFPVYTIDDEMKYDSILINVVFINGSLVDKTNIYYLRKPTKYNDDTNEDVSKNVNINQESILSFLSGTDIPDESKQYGRFSVVKKRI